MYNLMLILIIIEEGIKASPPIGPLDIGVPMMCILERKRLVTLYYGVPDFTD